MSFVSRLDDFQRRHPVLGFPLGVTYKFFDDQGGYLAALITYYGFVSLFPLLLVFTTVLGILLEHHEKLKDLIVDSALNQIPVIGDQLTDPAGLSGGTLAVIIGLVGAVYGGLGVAVASQNAMNAAWNVPRNSRPNPVKVRLRGVVLLLTVGLSMIGVVAINVTAAAIDLQGLSDLFTRIGALVVSLGVFVFGFRFGTARPLTVRQVLPGALLAAAGWQLLQHFGGVYIQHVISRTEKINGVFAVVLGLIAFLYLASVLVVIAMEVNSVLAYKLYPRALTTIFTDKVHLTAGDERAYRRLAQAQRQKGFETVTVTFDNPLDRQDDDGGEDGGGGEEPEDVPDEEAGDGVATPEPTVDQAAEPGSGEGSRGGASAAAALDEDPEQATSRSWTDRGDRRANRGDATPVHRGDQGS